MTDVIKQAKILLRGVLLLPVHPRFFRLVVGLLRFVGVLPRSGKTESSSLHILVVNLTPYIGDIVMFLPFLEELHASNPGAVLEVAVGKPMGSFLGKLTFLEQVHEIDVVLAATPPILYLYRRFLQMVRYAIGNFSGKQYDLCVLPRWGMDPFGSAYLGYLSNAPVRCGHDPREDSGNAEIYPGTRSLLTKAIRAGHGLPEALRELRLLTECGLVPNMDARDLARQPILSLQTLAKTVDAEVWKRIDLDPKVPFAVIAPGASAAYKRWPPKSFAKVAEWLSPEVGYKFIALGSAAEVELGLELEAQSGGRIRSLVGKTSLVETIAILYRAKFFLGNDSGPAHIAAGLGVPTVVVSVWPQGSAQEVRVIPVGPWVRTAHPQRCMPPCTESCSAHFAHCILTVDPADVFEQSRLLICQPG